MFSPATRLALAFALLGPVCALLGMVVAPGERLDPSDAGGVALFLGAAWALAGYLVAAYLRYEIVATGTRGGVHYFLVWDRWSGEVKVEARTRGEHPGADYRPASH